MDLHRSLKVGKFFLKKLLSIKRPPNELSGIIWQIYNLYRMGTLPAGVLINVSITDVLTREVKFQLEPQYVKLVAPTQTTDSLDPFILTSVAIRLDEWSETTA